jgi:hypothetical protein
LLAEDLKIFCDFEILPEKEKFYGSENNKYNIDGMAFGITPDSSKNYCEYILLKDNSIAFYDVDFGIAGRIAESTSEMFELLLNIPEWRRFNYIGLYKNKELLNDFIKKVEK